MKTETTMKIAKLQIVGSRAKGYYGRVIARNGRCVATTRTAAFGNGALISDWARTKAIRIGYTIA